MALTLEDAKKFCLVLNNEECCNCFVCLEEKKKVLNIQFPEFVWSVQANEEDDNSYFGTMVVSEKL